MTTTEVPHDGPGPEQRRRLPTGWLVLGALLLAAGCAGSWWWSHPSQFIGTGTTVESVTQPKVPVYIGLENVPAHESIHLIDARPQIVSDAGAVRVQVLVCRIAEGRAGVGVLYDVTSECQSLRPPTGRAQGNDQLVLEVSSDDAGTVAVEGITVTYRTPYQRGSQSTGPTVHVTISP